MPDWVAGLGGSPGGSKGRAGRGPGESQGLEREREGERSGGTPPSPPTSLSSSWKLPLPTVHLPVFFAWSLFPGGSLGAPFMAPVLSWGPRWTAALLPPVGLCPRPSPEGTGLLRFPWTQPHWALRSSVPKCNDLDEDVFCRIESP